MAGSSVAPRTALIVLGMHRSGTSMLTRVLSHLGAALPQQLIGADPDNPSGYWEPQALNELDEQLLVEAGSRWDDWRPLDLTRLPPDRVAHYRAEIARIVQEQFGNAPLLVIKEPRIARFVPLVEDALGELGIATRFVIATRSAHSVARSLAARDGMTPGFALLLWLRHILEAERSTRGKTRAFIAYESMLADWRPAIARLVATMDVAWPTALDEAAPAIDAFISPDLQHHGGTSGDPAADLALRPWIDATQTALTRLVERPADEQAETALDGVDAELDAMPAGVADAFFDELGVREAKWGAAASGLSGELANVYAARAIDQSDLATTRETIGALEADNKRLRLEADGLRSTVRQEIERSQRIEAEANAVKAAAEADAIAHQQFRDAAADRERAQDDAIAELNRSMASARENAAASAGAAEVALAHMVAEAALRGQRVTELEGLLAASKSEADTLRNFLAAAYASTSWRLTAPVRLVGSGVRGVRRTASRTARAIWRRLPLAHRHKQRLKSAAFVTLAPVVSRTVAYREWRQFTGRTKPSPTAETAYAVPPGAGPVFVPRDDVRAPAHPPARLIAFYLPQFHPIPENDQWWGAGFTEWTNVRAAAPQFEGHNQPRRPADLGYYDLRDKDVQRRQIALAKQYGIQGFCFYLYWFGGKRLLETPVDAYLGDRSLDLPFCVCWANENWTRRWDGLDSEVLIGQRHSAQDDLAFIAEVSRYLRDPRAIRIDGRPLLLVYRPSLLPSARDTAGRWRSWCRDNGIGEIWLAYTQSFEREDPATYGFDAAIEFPPNNSSPPNITETVRPLHDDFAMMVYDWRIFLERSRSYDDPGYKLFRTVCPDWDNTARRKNSAAAFLNSSPAGYGEWLRNAIDDTVRRFDRPDERLIFVNAWNEWAEGAYLEPDASHGYAYLAATREALAAAGRAGQRRLVLVTHDCHPHGSQLLTLEMARECAALGYGVTIIALEGGPLLGRFREAAETHMVDLASRRGEAIDLLRRLRSEGAALAVASTTVSGAIVPDLKAAGFAVVSLIHELPGVLRSYGLQAPARAIAQQSDAIVFPARLVQTGFEEFVGAPLERAVVRPQGLLRRNPYKGRADEARRIVCERHRLPPGTRYVLGLGYVDYRKGADLFVETAARLLADDPTLAFLWVGHADAAMLEKVEAAIARHRLGDRVRFVGFADEPTAYIAGAAALALTSREDPFPNVVIEAADTGVPVVAFAGATGAGAFIESHGGALAPAFDTDRFAAALRQTLDRPRPSGLPRVGSLRQYLLDLVHLGLREPRVSVIVPNYNYARHLGQRIASIAGQTWPVYEIIVLDDASTDDSVATIRGLMQEHAGIDITLVESASNSGSAFRQWQKGLAACSGDLVWIAEADDLADPTFLETLVPAIRDGGAAMAYSQSRQIDGNGAVLSPDYLDYTNDISADWSADYRRDGRTEIGEALSVKNTIPNVSAVLFRRDALMRATERLGDRLFSFRFAGDWAIYLEMMTEGDIAFSATTLNSHRRHADSVTSTGDAQRHYDEVVELQSVAAKLAIVSPATASKAEAWRAHLRRYLKLPARAS